jgi:hypothetical protein
MAKRPDPLTEFLLVMQPVTAGVSRVARFAGRVIPKPWEKKGAGRPVDEKTAEARYQKDVERAQKADEKRLLKEEKAQKRRERREQFEKIIDEKVGGAKAFLDEQLFFNKIMNLRPEDFRLPWGDQRWGAFLFMFPFSASDACFDQLDRVSLAVVSFREMNG